MRDGIMLRHSCGLIFLSGVGGEGMLNAINYCHKTLHLGYFWGSDWHWSWRGVKMETRPQDPGPKTSEFRNWDPPQSVKVVPGRCRSKIFWRIKFTG